MDTIEEIVSDEELDKAWGNANFGDSLTKRDVVASALLKYACGYITGHYAQCICVELGLVTKNLNLTIKGKRYLYLAFKTTDL